MKTDSLVAAVTLLALLLAAGTAVYEYAYHQYGRENLPGSSLRSPNGMLMHFAQAGEGTPVILVHGMGTNLGLDWERPGIFHELSKKYKVVALDLCGYWTDGKPRRSAEYGIRTVEDVVWLMDHLKIKKAHVVGYSMGGFITLKMAAMHPERMLSVATCASGWTSNPERDFASLHSLANAIENGGGYAPLLKYLQSGGKPINPMWNKAVSVMMAMRSDAMDVAAMLRSVDALRVDEAELRNNKLPALSLIGERDVFKPMAYEMCAVMGNVREVVIPDGDHFSTLSRPEFLAELEKFLAENSPASLVKTGAGPVRQPSMAKAA